jgi:inosine-uridine nucleoside N-ribohydrolase
MNNPLLVGAVQAGLDVFWWDPLAALAATDARLVDYRFMRITVVQDGVSSGRTIESPTGTGMRVGVFCESRAFRKRDARRAEWQRAPMTDSLITAH